MSPVCCDAGGCSCACARNHGTQKIVFVSVAHAGPVWPRARHDVAIVAHVRREIRCVTRMSRIANCYCVPPPPPPRPPPCPCREDCSQVPFHLWEGRGDGGACSRVRRGPAPQDWGGPVRRTGARWPQRHRWVLLDGKCVRTPLRNPYASSLCLCRMFTVCAEGWPGSMLPCPGGYAT